MLFSYVSVVLSICTCIAELSSEILGEMQLELLFMQLLHWNRHWGSRTSITKIKIFSLLLVKQRLFSGLLIGRGKKGKFRGIFRVRFTEKLVNFTGILHKFFPQHNLSLVVLEHCSLIVVMKFTQFKQPQ